MRKMPLRQVHEGLGATFSPSAGWELPIHYGDMVREYWAARHNVALIDRSHLGRLELRGADAKDLLERLSTNKLADLAAGQGRWSILTTPKGRIIDRLLVAQAPDYLLVITSPGTSETVASWIERYTISEDASTVDVGDRFGMLGVVGPESTRLLSSLAEADFHSLPTCNSTVIDLKGVEILVVRSDPVGTEGYDLIVENDQVEGAWTILRTLGAMPVGQLALEVLRIEAGIPRYGHELGEQYNPLEAGLLDDVSFTKGCYVGQEVVARLNTYMKVKQFLMGIKLTGQEAPPRGSPIFAGGQQVGHITSAAWSFGSALTLGMAYVARDHARPDEGVAVELGSSKRVPAELFNLPSARHYADTMRPSNWEELAKLLEDE